MMRSVLAITLFVSAWAACADEKDPVREKLYAARVTYDKEMALFRKQADAWFDQREATARRGGDKKTLDQLKVERELFDEDGELPKNVPVNIQQKPVLAKKALERAYGEAVKTYTKAKKDDKAAGVEKEWAEFVAKGNAVELLARVDPKAHALNGPWKKDEDKLVCAGAGKSSWLQLPYEPGEEYDVEMTCHRSKGGAVGVGLVAGRRQVLALVDARSGAKAGFVSLFSHVDKKHVIDNVTAVKGAILGDDRDHTIACSVRSGKIELLADDKSLTSFRGNFDRLSLPEDGEPSNKKALLLFVGANTSVRIDRITVTPVKGKGKVLR